MQRAAVDRGAAHDFVARLYVRHQDGGRRALAGREQQRCFRAIERRQLALGADDSRVRVARIQELRRPAFVVRQDFLRAVEDEGRRLVDRRRQRHGVAAVDLSRVNAAFFMINGYVSVLFFLFWSADIFLIRRGI